MERFYSQLPKVFGKTQILPRLSCLSLLAVHWANLLDAVCARPFDTNIYQAEQLVTFCPTCGFTVYWEGESFPGYVAVATGNFADPNFPAPTIAAWEESRHPWVSLSFDTPPKRVAKQG